MIDVSHSACIASGADTPFVDRCADRRRDPAVHARPDRVHSSWLYASRTHPGPEITCHHALATCILGRFESEPMLMPHRARLILPIIVVALALGTIASAQPESTPADIDAARLDERYGIEPGAEQLLAAMLGSGETLSGGCKLADGRIERTAVVATYTCSGGEVVLQLDHPDVAPPGGVRTERFAIAVKSGTPPAGFVDAVAERIRAREGTFQWKTLGGATQQRHWVLPAVAAAAAAVLLVWALRRLARRPAA